MVVEHLHPCFKKPDYVQQSKSVNIVPGQLLYSDIPESRNGLDSAPTLNVTQERLNLKVGIDISSSIF